MLFLVPKKSEKLLLKLAPPVMLAQLIQALYNIVDSFFVGKYSEDALTALTVIYPMQLIIIALAVGTGVGVNTYMARKFAQDKSKDAYNAAGTGTVIEFTIWAIFAIISVSIMRPICYDLGYIRSGDNRCGDLWKYSLHREHRCIFRRKLDKGSSITG